MEEPKNTKKSNKLKDLKLEEAKSVSMYFVNKYTRYQSPSAFNNEIAINKEKVNLVILLSLPYVRRYGFGRLTFLGI